MLLAINIQPFMIPHLIPHSYLSLINCGTLISQLQNVCDMTIQICNFFY